MKPDLTDITIVLDRSGSMEGVKTDTIGGFNAFIEAQKSVPGQCLVSLVQFDEHYEQVYTGMDVNRAPKLTNLTFEPRGSTALHGAIGRAVGETGQRLERMQERNRPGKVIVVVITDGLENASGNHEWSRIHTARNVKDTIRHQTDRYNWEFVFIGANQDAILAAQDIGISRSHAINYCANQVGTQSLYSALADNVRAYRVGAADTMAWNSAQHDEQELAKSITQTVTKTSIKKKL